MSIGEGWDELAAGQTRDTAIPRFFTEPMQDDAKSAEAGRPIFRDVEFIEIRVPGDKDNIPRRPVKDKDRQRFARQYEAWKRNQANPTEGTPLSEWPPLSKSQVEELRHFGVLTLESLAGLSDGQLDRIGPLKGLRAKAQDALMAAAKGAPMSRLQAENETLRSEVELLKQQLADVVADLGKAKKAKKSTED